MPLSSNRTAIVPKIDQPGRLNRLSQLLAIAVFVLAPLPFGSVEGPWILLWIVALATSLTLADFSGLQRAHIRLLLTTVALLAGLLLVVTLQLWPQTGAGDHIWAKAGTLLGQSLDPRASTSTSQPMFALGPALMFILAFLRAIILGTEPGAHRTALRAISITAIVYIFYSGLMLASGSTMLLWREKEGHLYNLTGTFTNRNTAATYFGSILLIWALQTQARARAHLSGASTYADVVRQLATSPAKLILSAGATLICLGALAGTGSRAGMIFSLLALGVAMLLYRPPAARRRATPLPMWIAAGLGIILMLELWGGMFATRIEMQGLSDAGRFQTYLATLQIIREHPILGIGLGNFEIFFPSIRPETMGSAGIWNRAHSTPLELAAELGLPFFFCLALVSCFWFISLWRFARLYRRQEIIVGLAVGILGLLHSLFDFSLQIPGYAMTFAALVGIGLSRGYIVEARQSVSRTPSDGEERPADG